MENVDETFLMENTLQIGQTIDFVLIVLLNSVHKDISLIFLYPPSNEFKLNELNKISFKGKN